MAAHVILRATNPALNMDRIYEMWLDKGLMGKWTVLVAHGPSNGGLTQRVYTFDSKEEAQAYMDKTIKQKLNSKQRIGADYYVVPRN